MDTAAQRPPFVELECEYVAVSKLKNLSKREAMRLRRPLVILVEGQPILVVVPMATYNTMQQMAIGTMGPILEKVALLAEEEASI